MGSHTPSDTTCCTRGTRLDNDELLVGLVDELQAEFVAFEVLCTYAAREGHTLVPEGHIEDRIKLGEWIIVQRMARARLSPDRRARLEQVPEWVWNARDARWDAAFSLLRVYAEREGHARVPQKHVEAGFRLGTWVNSQRLRRYVMDAERRRRLEQVVGWTWGAPKGPTRITRRSRRGVPPSS